MLLISGVGRFYDGNGGAPLAGISLLVDAGKVRAIGEKTDLESIAANSELTELDAHGKTLIPGLVDAHVHLTLPGGPDSLRDVQRVPAEELTTLGVLNAQRALRAGVTHLRDCGAPGRAGPALAKASRLHDDVLPRIDSSGPCITTPGGHGESIGVIADSSFELKRAVRELCALGVDFIKVMATGGSSDAWDTRRGRAQYSEDELRGAILEAHRLGRRVVCHANGTEGIRHAVQAGSDVIAHCNWLDAGGEYIDWDQVLSDAMVDHGIAVDLNVRGALSLTPRFAGGPLVRRWELFTENALASDLLYLTSDGFGPGVAHFPQMLVDAAQQLDIAPALVVKLATTAPARALGLEGAGGVEVGSRADLLLLNGDLEEDIRVLAHPDSVLLGGRLVHQSDTRTSQGAQ